MLPLLWVNRRAPRILFNICRRFVDFDDKRKAEENVYYLKLQYESLKKMKLELQAQERALDKNMQNTQDKIDRLEDHIKDKWTKPK